MAFILFPMCDYLNSGAAHSYNALGFRSELSQITNQHSPFVVSWPIRQPYLCLHEQMANAYGMLQAHNRQNKLHVVGPVQFGKHTGPYHASSWRQPQADPLSPHRELSAGGGEGPCVCVCVWKGRQGWRTVYTRLAAPQKMMHGFLLRGRQPERCNLFISKSLEGLHWQTLFLTVFASADGRLSLSFICSQFYKGAFSANPRNKLYTL